MASNKDKVLTDVKNGSPEAETQILGPNYDYSGNIPGPSSLGVGGDGSFGQLFRNLGAVGTYVKVMTTGDGKPLGNSYFVSTGGTCVASDGSEQARKNYINNFPGGSVPPGLSQISGGGSALNGLLPGIVGDIKGLNPVYLFKSMTEEGTPSCDCYRCGVTSGSAYAFLTPSLSPDFNNNVCAKVDIKNCVKSKEKFTNQISNAIPTILAVVGILLLTFSGK
jgi:hypothetical protein